MQASNKYTLALEEEKTLIQTCQKQKNINSCMRCDLIVGCKKRINYVQAVYNSMNHGKGGGFEF